MTPANPSPAAEKTMPAAEKTMPVPKPTPNPTPNPTPTKKNAAVNTAQSTRGTSLNDLIKTHYGSFVGTSSSHSNSNITNTVNTNNTTNNSNSNHSSNNYCHYNENSCSFRGENEGTPCLYSHNHCETSSVETEDSSIIHSIVSNCSNSNSNDCYYTNNEKQQGRSLRRLALELSLWSNVFITLTKAVAYCQTLSLSVLAALLDSLLDVVSQLVLNYTEKHSSMQRSSALYPAGASRLEPIGVLTCASLMGMASFEVLKESFETLITKDSSLADMDLNNGFHSAVSMAAIVVLKLLLLWLCNAASKNNANNNSSNNNNNAKSLQLSSTDPTLEAVAQDHWNDALSNGISVVALLLALYSKSLWWCDSVGAIAISIYIIHSWYHTGKEQIEHLTGKSAPSDLIEELMDLAEHFDERLLVVDTCRAYHFGPKFLVELEVVMPMDTLLKESHDLGMELQYEIEAREEVERCFVHIDYESRDYDEHVVSKVPELREHLLRQRRKKDASMSV